MTFDIKKIDLFSYPYSKVGNLLDEAHSEDSLLYSSSKELTYPIYQAMGEALIAEKKLDQEQQQIVTKRIKEIVAEAAVNLGMSGIMGQSEIKISDLQKLRNEVKRIVLCVSNKKPLFQSLKGKEELTPIEKVFRTLLSDEIDLTGVVNREMVSAIFWERDPKMLKEARNCVQKILDGFDTSDGREPTLAESSAIENLLTFYPLFDPQEGEILVIPEWTGNSWKRVPFAVEPIQLTHSSLASPMFAYGLVPKEEGISAKLLFKQTTYPADRGAFLSILSDVNPGASIGEYAFHMGFSALEGWFERHSSPDCKADVFGQSLGGSLALLASAHFGEKIRKAHAFSPPAPWPWSISQFDVIPKERRPDVRIFCQWEDRLPKLGWGWHPDWKVHHVFASKDHGAFLSHAKAFTAEKGVLILDAKSEVHSATLSRKAIAITQFFCSFILFERLSIAFMMHRIFYAMYRCIKETPKNLDQLLSAKIEIAFDSEEDSS